MISSRIDWFNLLSVQGTLKSLLSTTIWKHQFFGSLSYGPTVTFVHDYLKNHSFVWITVSKVISLLFNTLSRFAIAFLLRSRCLLISWLQSMSTVILKSKKIKSVTSFTFSSSIYHDMMGRDGIILCFLMLIQKLLSLRRITTQLKEHGLLGETNLILNICCVIKQII